jgi:hypothetical protein
MPEIADQRLGHPSLTCGNVGDSPRLVLGELLNPAHDGCYTVESLAKATALGLLQVEKAWDLCRGPEAEGMRFKVWKAPWTEKTSVSNKDSGPLYTLASHKPPLFERIGRQCLNWLSGR